MAIDWQAVQKALSPIKDFEDLHKRLEVSFGYAFVRKSFDLTMPDLSSYSQTLLGGDARGRYNEYLAILDGIITRLYQSGVERIHDLISRTNTRQKFEAFVEESGVQASEVITLLKYLIYWLIPGEKYISGLVQANPEINRAIKVLGECGVRTNLELLQKGITEAGRKSLANSTGLPAAIITDLVNRADLSRLPWASKATISNIVGAGYGSLEKLAGADPLKLYQDFYAYGKSIGKNLKLGNEIENNHRVAKIVPVLLKAE